MQTSNRMAAVAASLAIGMALSGCTTTAPKSPEQAQGDRAAAERIYAALDADPTYYFRHVDVRVDDGVAHLSGYIWSTDALMRAKTIAARVPGVKSVVNEMELERNGRRGGGNAHSG